MKQRPRHDLESDTAIRRLFAEAHRSTAPPKPFQVYWNQALARRETHSRRPPAGALLVAVGAVTALLIVAAVLLPRVHFPTPPSSAGDLQVVDLMAWRGPLDFLLETPGHAFLAAVPDFSGEIPTLATEVEAQGVFDDGI